jgi:predicted Rossmann-fold nucleotide-binding protein
LGFYDRLIQFLEYASQEKFVARQHREILIVEKTADALLDRFEKYRPHQLKKSDWAKSLRDRKN